MCLHRCGPPAHPRIGRHPPDAVACVWVDPWRHSLHPGNDALLHVVLMPPACELQCLHTSCVVSPGRLVGSNRAALASSPLGTSLGVAGASLRCGSALTVPVSSSTADDRRTRLRSTRSPTAVRHARTAHVLLTTWSASVSSSANDARTGLPNAGPKTASRRSPHGLQSEMRTLCGCRSATRSPAPCRTTHRRGTSPST